MNGRLDQTRPLFLLHHLLASCFLAVVRPKSLALHAAIETTTTTTMENLCRRSLCPFRFAISGKKEQAERERTKTKIKNGCLSLAGWLDVYLSGRLCACSKICITRSTNQIRESFNINDDIKMIKHHNWKGQENDHHHHYYHHYQVTVSGLFPNNMMTSPIKIAETTFFKA